MNENIENVSQLLPWEANPRQITAIEQRILDESLEEYGDLSVIVYNRKMQCLVGGHQRVDIMARGASVHIERRYSPPTAKGTVAEGYIEYSGEKYPYREVEWDEARHAAAAISANKAGGKWEFQKLKELMAKLDGLNVAPEKYGFVMPEVENLFGSLQDLNKEKQSIDFSAMENGEDISNTLKEMADGVKKAILIEFDKDDYPEAFELVKYFRNRGDYVGGMLMTMLRDAKAALAEGGQSD